MVREFKEFAFKGNLIDVAVGFVLGVAFTALVQSLVDDLLMQAVAVLFGEPDFSALAWGSIRYGAFLTALANFLIVAWALFLVVKAANRAWAREVPADQPLPQPAEEVLLLREIRDALAAR